MRIYHKGNCIKTKSKDCKIKIVTEKQDIPNIEEIQTDFILGKSKLGINKL